MHKYITFFLGLAAMAVIITAASCSDVNVPTAEEDSTIISIKFDSGYPGAPGIAAVKINSGTAAESSWPADPIRLGYTFEGWFSGTVQFTAQTIIKKNVTVAAKWSVEVSGLEDQPSKEELAMLFSTAGGFPSNLSNSWKIWGHHNALFTHHFGADPTVMVYEDRAYLFASNDTLLYEAGQVKQISYGAGIQGITASSSADLVNWTDHGVINIAGPESTNPLVPTTTPLVGFANASWAPSATWKMMGSSPKFFLYYANSGNGIGVVTADSPTGPWSSPLKKLLIDRNTPNCANVEWLFDPGVFIDDEARGFLFFGGGQNYTAPNNSDNTGNARRVRLGYDMISLMEDPEDWYVPYLFEDSELAYINGKYYYSYCTNWGTGGNSFGLSNCQIAYMTASDPMGQFSNPKGIMASPANQLGSPDENNHHCIFQFKNQTYIAYHASKVAQAMGLGFRYRSAFIDKVTVNTDGSIAPVTMTRKGVTQLDYLDPYVPNEAETIGIQGGIYTMPDAEASNGMTVTSIDTGDWLGVYGVDFTNVGANRFIARVKMPEVPADYTGAIEIRLDPSGDGVTGDNGNLTASATTRIMGGEVIGRVYLKAKAGNAGKFTTIMTDLDKTVTGVHDLVFVFYSSLGVKPETVNPDTRHNKGFSFDQWQFFR